MRGLSGFAVACVTLAAVWGGAADRVDFAFSPPEWQAAICLPDDPQKSLVDKSGALLYHYRQGGREFGTRIAVEVASNAVWRKQELLTPRVPIVRTRRSASELEILEEAFAVTGLPRGQAPAAPLRREDDGGTLQNWADPDGGADEALRDIAVHFNGPIRYSVAGSRYRIALALCEGWWSEAGKRKLVLRVEGQAERTVDTVADIGKNRLGVYWFDGRDADADGRIDVAVESASDAADKNTILNGLLVFPPDTPTNDAAVVGGAYSAKAVALMKQAVQGGPSRNDVVLVHVSNAGKEARTLQPVLVADTKLGAVLDGQRVIVNGHETVTCSLKLAGPLRGGRAPLEALTVPAGETATFFVLYSTGGTLVVEPKSVEQALACRQRAIAFWERDAGLPYGRIEVPDAGIQALVDSSIRNIWQAREIKKGLPAFQVGPTCYRGLWIVDGAFLLEAATILGAGDQARSGVAYELTHQQPDGGIKVMSNFSKENGIVLWTCVRHARLTQDKAWLESVWPKLARVAAHIQALRKETLANGTLLDDGLVPPGFPDGGIGGTHAEYTNPYWNLVGLHAFVDAARWLGKDGEAVAWQKEYDDFMAAFRKAAARDMKADARGNRYLPIRMDGEDLPQRGQWGFCHAVYPGQLFAKDDPLVSGNLAMLEAAEREGLVYGTGWDATGIWNYFASFYGHDWLWQGRGRKAAQILYAFANHASPVLDWREEQSLRKEAFKKVGDMPHNWASAEFIRLTTHLLELDRGDELHLFEGLPAAWTRPGMATRLNGVATPFGDLTLDLTVAADGRSARLRVEPLRDPSCKRIVVHLENWAADAGTRQFELDPKKPCDRAIPL